MEREISPWTLQHGKSSARLKHWVQLGLGETLVSPLSNVSSFLKWGSQSGSSRLLELNDALPPMAWQAEDLGRGLQRHEGPYMSPK